MSLTLKASVENINVGCSHESKGTYESVKAGLVGPLSLISPLGDRIDNKFSYCLVPYSNHKFFSTFDHLLDKNHLMW